MVSKYYILDAELISGIQDALIQLLDFDNIIIKEIYSDVLGMFQIDNLNEVKSIVIKKESYYSKTYNNDFPKIIRLLSNKTTGYLNQLSYFPGDVVKVSHNSISSCTIQVYRYGQEKENILEIKNIESVEQRVPDNFFVSRGLSWKESFSFEIPNKIEAGLYGLSFVDKNGISDFTLPFIVASPKLENKIVVLASASTWLAYNFWGGRSRYFNEEKIPVATKEVKKKGLKGKIKNKVIGLTPKSLLARYSTYSYKKNPRKNIKKWREENYTLNRPLVNYTLNQEDPNLPFQDHLAGAEWRLLAWLEKQNIAYDFIADFDIPNYKKTLDDTKTVILNTHCEYWSKEMFDTLFECHLSKGLSLLNLSGNSIYREIKFDKKGYHFPGNYFYQSCKDETEVIEVRYDIESYGTAAPYRIINRKHWAFDNIPLKENETIFGQVSLNQNGSKDMIKLSSFEKPKNKLINGAGASGWEVDRVVSPKKSIEILAEGLNNKGQGAQMIIKEKAGTRGVLFSVSSIMFNGSLLVDQTCSKIIINVINHILDKSNLKNS